LDANGSISIGYRVRSENQNRGIATESLRLLINELTMRFPERTLIANVEPQKAASLRVLAKCGFSPVLAEAGALAGATKQILLKYSPPSLSSPTPPDHFQA
jgi:L-amino acid N-acyltransferase YncA